MIRLLVALALALSPALAAAQDKPPAAAPADSYRHVGSGMGAPADLAGFERREVRDPTGTGRDVMVQYRAPDQTFLTVYFYRSPYPSAALWFEQARRSLEANPMFGGGAAANRPVRTFATGGATEDALLVTYPLPAGQYRSTGLAVAVSGNWIVKLRMTSPTLDAAALSDRVAAAARALRWPRRAEGGRPIASLAPCRERLPAARDAQQARSSDALRAAATRLLTASVLEARPAPICFDRQEELLGIYREQDQDQGYLLALGDNGRLARVRRLNPQDPDSPFVVLYYDLDAAYVAGFYRGLPTPNQVLQSSDSAMRSGGIARVRYVDDDVRPGERGVPVT